MADQLTSNGKARATPGWGGPRAVARMTKLPTFASRTPDVADETPLRRELVFVVPGRLDQLTGGYLFDRHIVEGLRARGRAVRVIEVTGGRPKANAAALAGVADGTATVVDGLVDGLRLGALVRWRDIEDDQRLVTAHPLLHAAVVHVAHYQIRNRGTVGGSLAHADSAAELPGVAVTCEGEITLFGPAGSRTVGAGDFFTGSLSTLRQPDEIITELHLPKWPSDRRWAFRKYSRREGDFALAGILLFYDEDRQGVLSNAHVGVIGACPRPHRLTRVETLLNGHALDDGLIRQAAATAAEEVDPPDDLHADAAYRRGLGATLIERGLRAAAQQGSA
jgi:carbon-monoxide dehydrogenase medium subunit